MTRTRDVTVRRATAADLDAVVALRLALLREYREHPLYGRLRHDANAVAHDVFARQLESSYETTFLADAGAEAVGILRCVETFASPLFVPERYCYVSSVYVRPDWRRRGVLRTLLTRAREWCAERGLTEMRLHSVGPDTPAAGAWDALGFEVVEQVRVLRLPATVEDVSAEVAAQPAHRSHPARA